MKNRDQQLDESYKISVVCFMAIVLILIFSLLIGCKEQIVTPTAEADYSGVYDSVPYEGVDSYTIHLELSQLNHTSVNGVGVLNGNIRFSFNGIIKKVGDNINMTIEFELTNTNYGDLHGTLNLIYDNDGNYYAWAGSCELTGFPTLAIRFKLTQRLYKHDQGSSQNGY